MAQITPVQNQVPLKTGGYSFNELTSLQAEVNQFVQKYLAHANSSLSTEVKNDMGRLAEIATGALQRCKGEQLAREWLVQPIQNGDRANLICPNIPVASSGRWDAQIPVMGYYIQNQSYYHAPQSIMVRLHPAQIANFPESVQQAIGDTSGKKVDCFLLADTTCSLKGYKPRKEIPLVLNLSMHAWAQPDYDGNDRTEMVSMGVYEPLNVYSVHTNEGVSFHHQKELPVICHPKQKDGHWGHALSPNNAHIGIDENANFSSFWLVAKLKDRVLVAKYILLNSMTDETSGVIFKSFTDSSTIGEFLTKLKEEVPKTVFQAFAEAAESCRNGADRKFDDLADVFKNYIYHKTWDILWKNKSVQPPHADFGRAAFHGFEDLEKKHHCTAEQKSNIILTAGTEFKEEHEILSNQLNTLFAPPKFIAPTSEEQQKKEKLLTPIAEAFQKNETEKAFALFSQLEQVHKHRIYQYVWESWSCQRFFAGDFGAASFHASPELQACYHCDNETRAQAILCYLHSI